LAVIPNIGINSGIFAAVPASVNLTSAAFPLTGTIRYYKIASGYSGTVSVGEGQFYTTLTDTNGLFQAINNGLISSDLTALITSDITEPGYFALNQTVEELFYTVTIKPDSAVNRTISGSYAGGLIRLNGADRITFDGRYNGSGNYLTFINTNATANSAVFLISSLGTGQGAVNNTIRNCNISAGSNTLTTNAVFSGGTAVGTGGADNDNLKIIENNISKCYYGVNIFGTSPGLHDSLEISDNIIGSADSASYVRYYGLYLSYMDSSVVSGNEIFNMIGNNAKYGIYMGSNISNNRFSGNKIHTFSQFSTGAYTTAGMFFSSATGAVNNQIDNNIIYDLYQYGSTTNTYNPGIRIVGGDGYKIYNNSISFTGAFGSTTAGCYCICLMVTTSSTNMDIRNNIFYNARTGNVPRSYTIYTVGGTTFTNLDYNIYYSTSSYLGFYNGTIISNFSDWKTATGKDMYSLSGDPGFTSATDLMPDVSNVNCWNENGKGIQIPSINSDFSGNPRSTLAINGPTDIGAYEFTPTVNPPEMTQTGVISGDSTTTYAQSEKTYMAITWGASNYNKKINNKESSNNLRTNSKNTGTSLMKSGDYPSAVSVKKYSGMTPPDTAGIPAPQMSKGYWYVDTDADPGAPVTVKIYWGDEELGSITDTSKLILAMYDMKNRVWVPYYRGTGDGYSIIDHANKTITVSGLTRLDSVCYALASSDYPLKRFAVDMTVLIEGLYYDGGNPPNQVPDTVTAELRTPGTYVLIDALTIPLDQYGKGYGYTVSNLAIPDNLFWLAIKHRNALETWCDTVNVKPMFSRVTGTVTYDFTTAQSQAFGYNMVLKNGKWCLYSGDVTKDGFIDGADMALLDIDLYNYVSGWVLTDLTGDMFVDGADMAILDVNLYNYIGTIKPYGAPGYIKAINKSNKVTKGDKVTR
jgi:hypothetical protein